MAEIWVDQKCSLCGVEIVPGEKATLRATVKTTAEEGYGNHRSAPRKVRVNFFTGSDRSIQHVVCPETP